MTDPTEDGFRNILKSINDSLGKSKLANDDLSSAFSVWWPKLNESLESIKAAHPDGSKPPKRSTEDLLLEILETNRSVRQGVEQLHALSTVDPIDIFAVSTDLDIKSDRHLAVNTHRMAALILNILSGEHFSFLMSANDVDYLASLGIDGMLFKETCDRVKYIYESIRDQVPNAAELQPQESK